MRRAAVFALFLFFMAGSCAHASKCNLALILGYDTSTSVDTVEYNQQIKGLAWALEQDDVMQLILRDGGVYLSAFEWSGKSKQQLVARWTWLNSKTAIHQFAEIIAGQQRRFAAYPTAIGKALVFALAQLKFAPRDCSRKVVDISGDGAHNDGSSPEVIYDKFDFTDITINALVISGAWPDPVNYYEKEVIRGPNAFVEVTNGYTHYAEAIRRKLLREIGNYQVGEVIERGSLTAVVSGVSWGQ